MTYEDAIKLLLCWLGCTETDNTLCVSKESCNDCKYDYDGEKIGDALHLAIEALEKQIPIKVSSTIDHSWGKETIQPVCPSCDYYLPRYQWIGKGKRVNYCETCGQAIDWSNLE